jgi:O-antigen ligase
MAAVVLLPLCQLVPLPPSLWHALPGREVVAEIDAGAGISGWRPLTFDVEGTIRAVLNLIPACVMLVLVLHLHTRERMKLLMIIGGFALFGAVLGIAQLATEGAMTPYPSSHIGYPIGLFVNRNHNAVFLLIAMPVIAAAAARSMRSSGSTLPFVSAALALLTILAVVVIGTTSRMAITLLPLALAASLGLLFFRQSVWRVAVPSMLVLGSVAAVVSWVGGLNRTLSRFSSLHEGRFDYWNDVSWALDHYGLAGTGFGTFIPIYKTAESLSSVSPAILNHAHNDFIEIVLEGGVPAIVLLVAFFAVLAAAVIQMMRKGFDFERASPRVAALIGIVMILIFSLVDYPLRMPALSCVFAVLCACVLPSPLPKIHGTAVIAVPDRRTFSFRMHAVRLAVVALACAVAVPVVQAGVSASQLHSNHFAQASAWAPWSTAAHEALSDDALISNPGMASEEAVHALRLSPIDANALRTVALVQTAGGSPESEARLMGVAASLGWRDPLTQLWAIAASQQTGEPEKAVERAEALFQQELFYPTSLELLLRDAPSGQTATALVQTLARDPPWRAQFFKAAAQVPPADFRKLPGFVAILNQTRAPLLTDEAHPLVDRLIASNNFAEATWLWAQARKHGLVANGGFERLDLRDGIDTPAEWDISDQDLATIAIQVPPFENHGRALRISGAARSGGILSQRLMLPPGSYSLSYLARSGGTTDVMLRWELRCSSTNLSQTSPDAAASSSRWVRTDAHFTVPLQDCPIQRLALKRPNDIHSPEVWIDDIVLKPSAR